MIGFLISTIFFPKNINWIYVHFSNTFFGFFLWENKWITQFLLRKFPQILRQFPLIFQPDYFYTIFVFCFSFCEISSLKKKWTGFFIENENRKISRKNRQIIPKITTKFCVIPFRKNRNFSFIQRCFSLKGISVRKNVKEITCKKSQSKTTFIQRSQKSNFEICLKVKSESNYNLL